MQTTTRATRAQLRRAQRRRAAERERTERARRVLARDTQLILDGLRQTRTVSEIHIELTRPIVGAQFALEKARRLEQTLQRLTARSLLSTPTTRGYLAAAAALRVSLERQQQQHPRRAIDWTTERLAQTVIDQALVATQPRKGELMNTTTRAGGERTLTGLPAALFDPAAIPPLLQPRPPAIQVAMPDGSTLEIPGARWPQPDIWAASERRALLGERPPVEVRRLTRKEANLLSADWHPLGAETRPFGYHAFALFVEREPLALATAGSAHSATVDRLRGLRRENCIELTRLCRAPTGQAAGSARVMLRNLARLPRAALLALLRACREGRAGVLLDARQGRPSLSPRRMAARARLQGIGRRRHLVRSLQGRTPGTRGPVGVLAIRGAGARRRAQRRRRQARAGDARRRHRNRPACGVSGPLRTEAQMLRALTDGGTYTLAQLYALCEEGADIHRSEGVAPPTPQHPSDTRWKRRVRGALMNLKRSGRAKRIGRSCWLLAGSVEQPRTLLLVAPGGHDTQIELHVSDAVQLLREIEEPVDLVLCDPPYGLGWDKRATRHQYARNEQQVLDGYQDVAPDRYMEFSHRWIAAAAAALRPGGQLVIVNGPQRAAHVQLAAEEQGLHWVCTIAARRGFIAASTRRPSPAHWAITVMCRGRVEHTRRVFNAPRDLPPSQAGNPYPLDWWPENGCANRPGLLRYATELPERLVRRLILSFSDPGEHVCDPMLGGGRVAFACWGLGRRFTGGDINPKAVQYTAARLLAEHAWPAERQPPLFTLAA